MTRSLPNPGDIFAVSLGDGRYCAVYVIRTCAESRSSLVALTPWLASEMPTEQSRELQEILTQNRGWFRGTPAVCWYEDGPTEDFLFVGNVCPPEGHTSIDPRGAFAGQWSVDMVEPVLLEAGEDTSCLFSGARPQGGAVEVEPMPMWEFWEVIESASGVSDSSTELLERIVSDLETRDEIEIAGFHATLCECLHRLDCEDVARMLASYGEAYFSPDHFLDLRCAVVAQGRTTFDLVVADPTAVEFEAAPRHVEDLLHVAPWAYERRTGSKPPAWKVAEVATFGNAGGWARE